MRKGYPRCGVCDREYVRVVDSVRDRGMADGGEAVDVQKLSKKYRLRVVSLLL